MKLKGRLSQITENSEPTMTRKPEAMPKEKYVTVLSSFIVSIVYAFYIGLIVQVCTIVDVIATGT
jgi:hypothetical protein